MTKKSQRKNEAHAFYREALGILNDTGVDYLLGGAFALFHYTGIFRDTKDLDIFCKFEDYPKILKCLAAHGYRAEMHDVRWLAKAFKDDYFIDIIFDSVNNICRVDDTWIEHASSGKFLGMDVRFIPAEELIWCKCFVCNRERYDGADINHVILRYGEKLNWRRLKERIEPHWHLLLSHIILFQFVYPADYRRTIPKWVFDELIERAREQYELPEQVVKVCRGPMIDNTQYCHDIKFWNYKSYTIKTI